MFLTSSQYAQDIFAAIFSVRKNGFFVEIGGYDPFKHSNSFWLESRRGWGGVCVEPDPLKAKKIENNRDATVINKAISTERRPLDFVVAGALSAIVETLPVEHFERIKREIPDWEIISVECVPFTEIDNVVPNGKIDFLTVDVEGHEVEVLKSIDFERVNISTMTIEYGVSNSDEIRLIMERAGFCLLFTHHADYFFVNKAVLNEMAWGKVFFKKILLMFAFLINDVALVMNRVSRVVGKVSAKE